jgi:hypothetical protein
MNGGDYMCFLELVVNPPRLVKNVHIEGAAESIWVTLEKPNGSPAPLLHHFPEHAPARTSPSDPHMMDGYMMDVTTPFLTSKVSIRMKPMPGEQEVGLDLIGLDVIIDPIIENITFPGPEPLCDPAGGTEFIVYGAELTATGTATVSVGGTPAASSPVMAIPPWRRHADGVSVVCPAGGGTDIALTLQIDGEVSTVPFPAGTTVSYAPPFVDSAARNTDIPVSGGMTFYLVGGAWGSGALDPSVFLDGSPASLVSINETHLGLDAPPLGYQASGTSRLTFNVVVNYMGQASESQPIDLYYAAPSIVAVTPGTSGSPLTVPLMSGVKFTVTGSDFDQDYGVGYTKIRIGGIEVPDDEVNHLGDATLEWTVGDVSRFANVGCNGEKMDVKRGNAKSNEFQLIWDTQPLLEHTSLSYVNPGSLAPHEFVEISGTGLGAIETGHTLDFTDGPLGASIGSATIDTSISSAFHHYYRLSKAAADNIAVNADPYAHFSMCGAGGSPQSTAVSVVEQNSYASSMCVVYLYKDAPTTPPQWYLNGQRLMDVGPEAQCRRGDRLVLGWDLREWSLEASACRTDLREDATGGCRPIQPPLGGPSQFADFSRQDEVCTTITNESMAAGAANCVDRVASNAEATACFSAMVYGPGMPAGGMRVDECITFGASAGAVTCEVGKNGCGTTCFSTSDTQTPGTCPELERISFAQFDTISECFDNSCSCACTAFNGKYRAIPQDFMPHVFNDPPTEAPTPSPTAAPTLQPTAAPTPQPTQTTSTVMMTTTVDTTTQTAGGTTASPASTAAPSTPNQDDALDEFVYGIVTLDGDSPYTLTGLPAPPLVAFAWRDVGPVKKRLVAPVDESFDPLVNIDYDRGVLADGDVVTDPRIVLRLPQSAGMMATIPEGTKLRYTPANGTETEVEVNDGALGRATDSRAPGTGSDIVGGGGDGGLSVAEIALVAIACVGFILLGGYVVQRARAARASGGGPQSGDVELAGTYTQPPRSGNKTAATTLESLDSYEAPPTRSSTTTLDDSYSAPPTMSNGSRVGDDDAGAYEAPPVKLAANDTLRRRAKEKVPKKFVIAPSDLDKGKLIGQGGYGYVYRGVWREVAVAIKEIREVPDPKVSREAVKQMVEEAIMMCDLRPHTNLIQFFGICLDPISIVLEFAAKGALEDALYGRKAESRIAFTPEQRVAICLGAGRGVHHLHQEGVVHRDLASRNVLLTAALVPKLTDFGMAREGAEDEATTTATRVGPIRWMAPEQLTDQVVSTASDVWSFGALMYEIYACEQPFGKRKNMAVAKVVMDGGHCDIPADAPETVRRAMTACFEHDHEKRVKMKAILTILEE